MKKLSNRETRKKEHTEKRRTGVANRPLRSLALALGCVVLLVVLGLRLFTQRASFLVESRNTTTFETGNLTLPQTGVTIVYDDTDLEFGNSHFRPESVDYNLFKSVAVVPDEGADAWWEFLVVENVKIADDYYKYRKDYLTWDVSSANPHDYFLRNWINPSLEVLASDTDLIYGAGEMGEYKDWKWKDLGVFADGEDFKLSMGLRTYFKQVGSTLIYATCYTNESGETFADFENYLASCTVTSKTSKAVKKETGLPGGVSEVLYGNGLLTVNLSQGESSVATGQRVKAGKVYLDGVKCSAHVVTLEGEKYLDFKTLDTIDLTSYGLVTESGYSAKVYIDVPPEYPHKRIELVTITLLDYDTGVYVDTIKVKPNLKVSVKDESKWHKKTPVYTDENLNIYYQGNLSGNFFYVVENLSSKDVKDIELEAGGVSYRLAVRGHLKTGTVQAKTTDFLHIPAYTYGNNLTVETLIESVSLNTGVKVTYVIE